MNQSFFCVKYCDGKYGSYFKLSFYPFERLGFVFETSANSSVIGNGSSRMGIEIILLSDD